MFELLKVVVGESKYTLAVLNGKVSLLTPEGEKDLREQCRNKLGRELPQVHRSFTYHEFTDYVKTHSVLKKIDWDKFFGILTQ